MDNRRFYTYAYLCKDGKPYYIGKGSGNRAYSGKGRNCNTPTDVSRILILKRNLTEEEAFKHEIYMIAVFGKKCDGTGILRNVSDGGSAPPRRHGDDHHMKKAEHRKNLSEKLKGERNPRWGKPLTSEAKQKMSKKLKFYTGERNHKSEWWKLTFVDGRHLVLCGLSSWCKENGYSKAHLSKVFQNKEGRTKHKDIVKVEKVGKPEPPTP